MCNQDHVMSLDTGILTTGNRAYIVSSVRVDVVPLDVIKYWNRSFVHEIKNIRLKRNLPQVVAFLVMS